MANMGLLGAQGAYLQNILDLRQRRQDIIAANVANVDTPGYKARRMDFEAAMKEAMPDPGSLPMARTSGQHLPMPLSDSVSGDMETVEIPIPKGDKNSVDLEQEMTRLSANQILYNYAAQAMTSKVHQLRLAIDGGNSGG